MKNLRPSLIVIALAASLIAPSFASGTTISIGPSVWYAWWQPAFESQYKGGNVSMSSNREFDINSTFLIGPAVSVLFNPYWSVSGLYMWTNRYNASSSYIDIDMDERIQSDINITKYDLDITINYTLTPSMRIFLGFKRQGYEYSSHTINISLSSGLVTQDFIEEATTVSTGPGAGMSYTMLLSETMFISVSASLTYMDTKMKTEIREEAYDTYGGNSSISLFYRPKDSPVTLSAGLRVQYLKHILRPGDSKPEGYITEDFSYMHNQRDLFYGLMFTAVYSFEI